MIKKKPLAILLVLLFLIPLANGPGSITLVKGTVIASKYGTLTVTATMTMASMTDYANGTINFNVTGYELAQLTYQFQLNSYGNGTFTIRFTGRIPVTVTDANALSTSYSNPWEQIQYNTAQNTPLIIIYGTGYPTETQTVGFRDDFLYTNPLLTTDWTTDPIFVPATQTGISTSTGYMTMTNTGSIATLTEIVDHVSSTPAFNPSQAITGTIIKRKLTTALIPFTNKQTTGTDNLRTGLTHLITAVNTYPQTGNSPPYGTPDTTHATNSCSDSTVAANNIGIEYFSINSNGGTVAWGICTDPSGTQISGSLPPIDVTRYTILTIITQAVFCSTCPDNAQPGSSWVYHRIYQEDSTGNIITGSDNNHNQTTATAPYYGTAPVYFFAAINTGGALPETTRIDFVQWQNYGSPVCLVAPTGALCTRLPPNPGRLTNDFIGSIAYLATLIGGGDEQAGAIIMFLIMSAGMAGMPYLFTKNIPFSALGEMSVLGFNIYAGFLPSWILFLVLLMGAVIIVMMVNRIIGGHSLMGGGGAVSE